MTITKKRLLLLKKEYSKMPEGSLQIKRIKGYYRFYHYIDSKLVYINNADGLLYKLARKKFLSYIINDHDTTTLLEGYRKAGLDLQRITLTSKQYRWVSVDYPKNTGWQDDLKYSTYSGVLMRSKSERDIGNELEYHAVPYRYDMLLKINVSEILDGLRDYLANHKFWRYNPRTLYTYRDGHCVWNVPEELQWMNAPGSIWRSFNYSTQAITISADFTIALADGSLLIWEHAGLCLNPVYRCNTSERIFVLRATSFVPSENILFTTENDVLNMTDVQQIITTKILPRI